MEMISALLTALKHDFIVVDCLPLQPTLREREREIIYKDASTKQPHHQLPVYVLFTHSATFPPTDHLHLG